MERYILEQLLEIERDLVIGDEAGKAPKTLDKVRKLTEELAIRINREEEKQMISNSLSLKIIGNKR